MKRIGNTPIPVKKTFTVSEIFEIMWEALEDMKMDRIQKLFVQAFLTIVHGRLILAENGWCKHGVDFDDCPDCRH